MKNLNNLIPLTAKKVVIGASLLALISGCKDKASELVELDLKSISAALGTGTRTKLVCDNYKDVIAKKGGPKLGQEFLSACKKYDQAKEDQKKFITIDMITLIDKIDKLNINE